MTTIQLHKISRKSGAVYALRWHGTDGRRFFETLGSVRKMTKREAERARTAKEGDIAHGTVPRNRPQDMTLDAFATFDRAAQCGDRAATTLDANDGAFGHLVAAVGKTRRLADVGPAEIGALKARLIERGAGKATRDKVLRVLRAAFNRAKRAGLLSSVMSQRNRNVPSDNS